MLDYTELAKLDKLAAGPPQKATVSWGEMMSFIKPLLDTVHNLDDKCRQKNIAMEHAERDIQIKDNVIAKLRKIITDGHDFLDLLEPMPPREIPGGEGEEPQVLTFAGRIEIYRNGLGIDPEQSAAQIAWADLAAETMANAQALAADGGGLMDNGITADNPPQFNGIAGGTPVPEAAIPLPDISTEQYNAIMDVLDHVDNAPPEAQTSFWAELPAEQRPMVEYVQQRRQLQAKIGEGVGEDMVVAFTTDPLA